MPHKKRFPADTKHRASGQAVVRISGRDHYLGPHGTKTRHVYNEDGTIRIVRNIKADNSNLSQTFYQHDRVGHRTGAKDVINDEIVTYDDGNLQQIEDRKGRVRKFTYHGLDRLITEEWFSDINDMTADTTLSWNYDELGRVKLAKQEEAGTLIYVDTFEYDNLDRVITQRNHDPLDTFVNPWVTQDFAYDIVTGLSGDDYVKSTASRARSLAVCLVERLR